MVDRPALQACPRELFGKKDVNEESFPEIFEDLQEAVKEFEAGLARPEQISQYHG